VGVALIDSGVAPVEGLDRNVVYGPDLSFDSQSHDLAYYDSFGHGTHMAGIIAGRDASATAGGYAGDTGDFLGMAPDAHIVSVKVADSYGDVDVSQLIAGIDWVVAHRDDPGLNIRVLNLSVGTESVQSYKLDPLAYAADAAWRAGIVVVAAAGNDGSVLGQPKPKPGQSSSSGYNGLVDPAYDPNIIAVGAADTQGTVTPTDDTVASFSNTKGNGGGADRKPDLVAPGVHVASLRDPGSVIDTNYGDTGGVDQRLMRGSGTSQATAVVSGAAALLLSAHPDATPGDIKAALTHSAVKLAHTSGDYQGAGELSLLKLTDGRDLPKGPPAPKPDNKAGSGSLQASRGTTSVVDPSTGTVLSGEMDIFGNSVDTAALAQAETAGQAWSGGTFNGSVWTGSGFDSSGRWSLATWPGQDWAGADFATSVANANGLAGHTWSGHTWSGHTWSGHTWSGHTWSGHTWSAQEWQ
ncbi:MAG TPA: S8 family serine peptidase, partial [Acidimicrobiales bacterium]|nr:S8 family serine peptidase [Acidimicrobiales bacterium]